MITQQQNRCTQLFYPITLSCYYQRWYYYVCEKVTAEAIQADLDSGLNPTTISKILKIYSNIIWLITIIYNYLGMGLTLSVTHVEPRFATHIFIPEKYQFLMEKGQKDFFLQFGHFCSSFYSSALQSHTFFFFYNLM